MTIDYDVIDGIAAKAMKDRKAHLMREKGFIYKHGKRTMASVIALRERIVDDDSHDNALRIAALFHDVGKGIEPHARTGAVLTGELLAGQLPAPLLTEVCELIRLHTEHGTDNAFARILQDADVLDHFGTLEIAMSFQYGAYDERGIEASLEWYLEHFGPYVERVRTRIKYPQSRDIFDEKVRFTHAFVERLAAEAAGQHVI